MRYSLFMLHTDVLPEAARSVRILKEVTVVKRPTSTNSELNRAPFSGFCRVLVSDH